jgi:hypothetical protein
MAPTSRCQYQGRGRAAVARGRDGDAPPSLLALLPKELVVEDSYVRLPQ